MAKDENVFGGAWTTQKLKAVKKYLSAYINVLKGKKLKMVYIDAYAGTGYHLPSQHVSEETASIFAQTVEFMDGSAKQALELDIPFDAYVFIEKNKSFAEKLKNLCDSYENRKIMIKTGDSNKEVQDICNNSETWRKWRGVIFLDPYGMDVDWSTMEAIAATKALDVWLLVPMGLAVNRLLPKKGMESIDYKLAQRWEDKLNRFFGDSNWKEEIYKKRTTDQNTIFGHFDEKLERISLEEIEGLFLDRLGRIFPAVHKEPLRLLDNDGRWLFSLCFMMANDDKRAIGPGMNIANHIMKNT